MKPRTDLESHEWGNCCGEWWPLLSIHADGETSVCEAREVEAHIAGCPECATEFAGLKRFSTALSSLTPIEPPAGLRSAILAHTIHQLGTIARIRNAFRIPQVQWASMAAAGAAAAVLYSFFQPGLSGTVAPTRLADRTPTSDPKPVIAQIQKPKSSPPAVKQTAPLPASVEPERELANLEQEGQPDKRKAAPAHLVSLPQPAAPRPSAPFRLTRASAPKPRMFEEAKPNITFPTSTADDANAVMMEVERMMNEKTEIAEKKNEAAPMPVIASQPARIHLIAASGGIPPAQIATLAGLKRELQSQKIKWNEQSVKDSLRDKQLRIDVLRGTF